MKDIIAIIPARSGSKGLKNKNILNLYGKPLIAWSIEFAKQNKYISRYIVSTDCIKIAELAKNYGAEIPFIRDKKLSTDDAKTTSVILDIIKRCKFENNSNIVLLEPTSPYRKNIDFENILNILKASEFKKAVSVSEAISSSYRYQFTRNKVNGNLSPIEINKYPLDLRRQDIENTYYMDGSFYVSNVKSYTENPGFIEKNTCSSIIDPFSTFEIDTKSDLVLMEALFNSLGCPFELIENLG